MNRHATYIVKGKPVPKGSRVAGISKSGVRFNREANKHVGPYMKLLKASLIAQREGGPLRPPYSVHCVFYFAQPKEPSRPRTGDVDKFARAALDALTQADVIEDDRHIVELLAIKRYGDPRTEIHVAEVDSW